MKSHVIYSVGRAAYAVVNGVYFIFPASCACVTEIKSFIPTSNHQILIVVCSYNAALSYVL